MARRVVRSEDNTLERLVGLLSLKDDVIKFEKSMGFMCWVNKPQELHMSNEITVEELITLLRVHLHNVQDSSDLGLPRLKSNPLEKPLLLRPYSETSPAALKPNLLMISLKLMDAKCKELGSGTPATDLVESTFSDIDFIIPRKVIKSIIINDTWEAVVSRPLTANSTVFIDRAELYETNDGSIGNLFTAAITVPGSYQRVYQVSRVTLGGSSIVLSGEIDAFDDDNFPVEIKSRPAWAKFDASRQFQTHTQCILAGVNRVLTGSFRAERGVRNGPVSFHKNDLRSEVLEKYALYIPRKMMTDAYRQASDVLKEIHKLCNDVGKVYKVRSVNQKGEGKLIEVEEMTSKEAAGFPITADVLERCAEACLTIAETTKNRLLSEEDEA